MWRTILLVSSDVENCSSIYVLIFTDIFINPNYFTFQQFINLNQGIFFSSEILLKSVSELKC